MPARRSQTSVRRARKTTRAARKSHRTVRRTVRRTMRMGGSGQGGSGKYGHSIAHVAEPYKAIAAQHASDQKYIKEVTRRVAKLLKR